MSAQHDLIFFEKRSTPKVVSRGAKFVAPESYGKQTRRRPATPEEEKKIARGDWLRVDQSGKKGGEPGYKKTRMAGRQHLVHEEDSMSEMSLDALSAIGQKYLAHYGVRGMRWGVRKDIRGGGGSVKVKFRPSYSDDEIRNARNAVKSSKKSGGATPKDREGFSQERIGKMRTPVRRAVNAVGGTKQSNVARAGGITAAVGLLATGSTEAQTLGLLTAGTTFGAANVYDDYVVYFKNLRTNPTVRLKTDLTDRELARYATGKTITKQIVTKKGSATVSINKRGSTVTTRDREGRTLGGQKSKTATRSVDRSIRRSERREAKKASKS